MLETNGANWGVRTIQCYCRFELTVSEFTFIDEVSRDRCLVYMHIVVVVGTNPPEVLAKKLFVLTQTSILAFSTRVWSNYCSGKSLCE